MNTKRISVTVVSLDYPQAVFVEPESHFKSVSKSWRGPLQRYCWAVFVTEQKVTANPKRALLIYFIIFLLSCLGFLRMQSLKNNDVADLFTPGVGLFLLHHG